MSTPTTSAPMTSATPAMMSPIAAVTSAPTLVAPAVTYPPPPPVSSTMGEPVAVASVAHVGSLPAVGTIASAPTATTQNIPTQPLAQPATMGTGPLPGGDAAPMVAANPAAFVGGGVGAVTSVPMGNGVPSGGVPGSMAFGASVGLPGLPIGGASQMMPTLPQHMAGWLPAATGVGAYGGLQYGGMAPGFTPGLAYNGVPFMASAAGGVAGTGMLQGYSVAPGSVGFVPGVGLLGPGMLPQMGFPGAGMFPGMSSPYGIPSAGGLPGFAGLHAVPAGSVDGVGAPGGGAPGVGVGSVPGVGGAGGGIPGAGVTSGPGVLGVGALHGAGIAGGAPPTVAGAGGLPRSGGVSMAGAASVPADGGDLRVLNAIARSPGMFHTGFVGSQRPSSVHSWLASVESVLLVSFGQELAHMPFERLRPVLEVNVDDSAKRFIQSIFPVGWGDFKRQMQERYGRTTQQVQAQLMAMTMQPEERVMAFFDRVEQVRSQATISDSFLYDVVRHRLAPRYLSMLAQKDADGANTDIGTYQGMRRWLENYEKVTAVSEELQRGARIAQETGGVRAGGERPQERRDGGPRHERAPAPASRDWSFARHGNWKAPPAMREAVHTALESVTEEPSPEEHLCHLTERCSHTSATSLLPTFDAVTTIAGALQEAELCPTGLQALAVHDPEAFIAVLEEGLETCVDVHGDAADDAAQALADLAVEMCNEVSQARVVHPDIEVDDLVVTKRRMADGTMKETQRPLRGTVKELVRGLRTTIPVFKLLQADGMVREYLLYCAISLVAAMGQPIPIPAGTSTREFTLDDWLQRGRRLAASTPHRFTLPPDSVMDLLAARMGRAQTAAQQGPQTMAQAVPQQQHHMQQVQPMQADEALRTVPIGSMGALSAISQLVGHLEEVCAAATGEKTGCETVRADLAPKKPLSAHLDKRAVTARKPGARYLDVILDSFRIWALRDTGANFSMVTTRLCRELGLVVPPFDKTFQLANGVTGKFAGCLPEVTLQLHDKLELTLRNVRVLDAKYPGMLLGTDVLSDEGNGVISLVSIARDGQEIMMTLEVMEDGQGSGLRVAVPLHRTEHGGPAVSAAAKEGNAQRCLGEASRSQMPRDVRAWCGEMGLSDRMTRGAWDAMLVALDKGLPLSQQACPACKVPHSDLERFATFEHKRHLCQNCKKMFDTDEKNVCNLLAAWSPMLRDGKLWLNKVAPKEFAGETTEMVAQLSVVPRGTQVDLPALFKYEAQAALAEQYLRDEAQSTDPVRDTTALVEALRAGVPIAAEVCPRCGRHVVDRQESVREPRKARVCSECNYEFTLGEPVVAHPLGRFNPALCRQTGKVVLLSTAGLRPFRDRGERVHRVRTSRDW